MIKYIFVFFMLAASPAAADYRNNIQYIDDPELAIQYKQDMVQKLEFIMLKPNILNFSNNHGTFHVNFLFTRDMILFTNQTEMFIEIRSKSPITAYDGFDQVVNLIITDGANTYQWIDDLSFNKREVSISVEGQDTVLRVAKDLSPLQFNIIYNILAMNPTATFYLTGLYGRFVFSLPAEVLNIYKTLFDYKLYIYKE